MPAYVNGRYLRGEVETVDEFPTYREAKAMLKEYRLSYGAGWDLWLSSRATAEWREANMKAAQEKAIFDARSPV